LRNSYFLVVFDAEGNAAQDARADAEHEAEYRPGQDQVKLEEEAGDDPGLLSEASGFFLKLYLILTWAILGLMFCVCPCILGCIALSIKYD
jgi:hypothetical protein